MEYSKNIDLKITDTYIDTAEYAKIRNQLQTKEDRLYSMTYDQDCSPEHIQLLKDQSLLVKENINKTNIIAKKLDTLNTKYPEEASELNIIVPLGALDKGNGGLELEQVNNELIRLCEAGEKP